jgi:ferric-dicitrate binding protein FerR (iron transport regulator)
VELVTGEAYFEIAHNPSQPFTVRIPAARRGDDLAIDVLGTSFDLNNYPDEPATKATLITGSVRVTKGQDALLLHPGEQAVTDSGSGAITVSRDINVASVVAWKDGNFSFDRAGTEAIMRELARWYDVEVSYEGAIPARQFVATIPRNVPASTVLKALELNNVHFRIEGKKIIVTP